MSTSLAPSRVRAAPASACGGTRRVAPSRSARASGSRASTRDERALPIASRVARSSRFSSVRACAAPTPLLDLADAGAGFSPLVPLLSVLGGFGIAKAFVYWRVQFITAAMIGKHVPPDAKRVLEFGVGAGKNLYYYPKTVGMVVGIDEDAKEDLLIQVSVAAGVPFVAKKQSVLENSNQADASVDAVVVTGALTECGDAEKLVAEAARVLKPGAPLVFVEDMSWPKGDGALAAIRASDGFEPAQFDDGWATLPLAACAIGVAVRKGDEAPGGIDKEGGAAAESFETATGLAGKRGKKKRGSGKAGKR